jgi:hypothetical protein
VTQGAWHVLRQFQHLVFSSLCSCKLQRTVLLHVNHPAWAISSHILNTCRTSHLPHPAYPQVLVKSTGERVYYPTTRLITLPVINLTRSTARSEKVLFLLDVGKAATSAREALLECVRCHYEENESDFNSCPR